MRGPVEIYDFTEAMTHRLLASQYGIGRYDEHRPGMYAGEQFQRINATFMGIDIAAPVENRFTRSLRAVSSSWAIMPCPSITVPRSSQHHWLGQDVYTLNGHLSVQSGRMERRRLDCTGQVVAWVGSESENGGWNSISISNYVSTRQTPMTTVCLGR